MNPMIGLLASCCATALLAVAAYLLLRAPLERLLTELCGSRERAHFWSCFTGLGLVLTTLLGCMMSFPLGDAKEWTGEPMVRLVLLGLRTGLGLLLVVLATLGFALGRAITRFEQLATSVQRGAGEPSSKVAIG